MAGDTSLQSIGPRILILNKPQGPTSVDIIRKFKKTFGKKLKKIGHFGTLDPFANGVLLIGFNGAMRFDRFIQSELPKTYVAIGKFGVKSPTGDLTSHPDELVFQDVPEDLLSLELDEINNILKKEFLGPYMQRPHAFSAAKHEGKALYEYAREGTMIEKPPVERFIYQISALEKNNNSLQLKVTVSSGTYIRVLFEDIAKRFDTLGTLETLERSSIGPCQIHKAINVEEINESNLADLSFRPDDILEFKKIQLDDATDVVRYKNGNPVNQELQGHYFWVYSSEGLLGLGEHKNGLLCPHINLSH